MTSESAALRDRIAGHFLPDPPDRLGVAVSGGSDSLALLVLLKEWRDTGGPELFAVTVDHRLRAESTQEAQKVAQLCESWGIPHAILKWEHNDIKGNVPNQARRARYGLMADWAASEGVGTVALGHTADDQAETFLMRLSREAGVDGLAAMSTQWVQGGVTFARPVLGITRAALREELQARRIDWIDDPTNVDIGYERTRARNVLAALAPLEIGAMTLSAVAGHLADARAALNACMASAAREIARIERCDVLIDRAGLAALEPEIARRLLQEALLWISGAEYPPRGAAMKGLMDSVADGQVITLHGCLLTPQKDHLRISREERAVAGLCVPAGDIWDGRWRLTGPDSDGVRIAALGQEGLVQCRARKDSPLPATSMRASPAAWRGTTLLAAPLAELKNGWVLELVPRDQHDFSVLLSH